jgi:hypothetical protein
MAQQQTATTPAPPAEWAQAQRQAIAAAFEKSANPTCPIDNAPLASTRSREIARWEILFRCPTCGRQYRYTMKMGF